MDRKLGILKGILKGILSPREISPRINGLGTK